MRYVTPPLAPLSASIARLRCPARLAPLPDAVFLGELAHSA
jgi:hypothetical protein